MSNIVIRPLQASDHAEWRRLWTAYLVFYKAAVSEEVYATTWRRLFDPGEFEPKGFLALVDGKAVGLVHYLYHRSCWSLVNNCYLQDLFADPSARGTGVGRALIEAVQAEAAKARHRQCLLDDARDQRHRAPSLRSRRQAHRLHRIRHAALGRFPAPPALSATSASADAGR